MKKNSNKSTKSIIRDMGARTPESNNKKKKMNTAQPDSTRKVVKGFISKDSPNKGVEEIQNSK